MLFVITNRYTRGVWVFTWDTMIYLRARYGQLWNDLEYYKGASGFFCFKNTEIQTVVLSRISTAYWRWPFPFLMTVVATSSSRVICECLHHTVRVKYVKGLRGGILGMFCFWSSKGSYTARRAHRQQAARLNPDTVSRRNWAMPSHTSPSFRVLATITFLCLWNVKKASWTRRWRQPCRLWLKWTQALTH